jgi:hypothetical protein
MLGWLAAAAAPLLIHLWSRHRFREVDWAAIQFLLAAMRKNARRLQLQQWLLLAVRTLLILLVVLAVAEPYGAGLVAGGSASAPTHKVLVIDSSYSMALSEKSPLTDREEQGGDSSAATRFTRARQLAADLVRNSSSADAFTVIDMASPPSLLLGREVVDSTAVADQIRMLPQSQTRADLVVTLELIAEALQRNIDDPRGLDRQEVYFFTDLQRVTWNPALAVESGSGAVRDRVAALAKEAALVVVDVGTPRAANLAATELAIEEPFVTVGREVPITATLRQFGDQPREDCVVELLVDESPVGEQTIDVPASGESIIHFMQRFNSPGSHAITLRASSDNLPIDNSRFLAVAIKERVRVLCVAGREGAARYIARALSPDAAADSAIDPVIVTEGDLQECELGGFDCIFLCNVAQLTANEAQRLTRYAEAGGGVVVFLGDRVVADQYNSLAQHKAAVPPESSRERPRDRLAMLIPARLGPVTTTRTFGIDPLEYRHPIVAPFRGSERAGLLTTPISRYFKLELPQPRAGLEVAAALAGGDPLIVAAPLGRGRTIVVATDGSLTSIDPKTGDPWTTWPTWPSFLPIVRELLAFATSGQSEQLEQQVGTALSGSVSSKSVSPDDTRLQIVRPDGRTDTLSPRTTTEGWQWSYDATNVSGIYTLRGMPDGEQQHFVVNVDTRESDLSKVGPAALPSELLIRDTWRDEALGSGPSTGGISPNTAWNVPLLWITLALLFVESFLAWQFGRGTL